MLTFLRARLGSSLVAVGNSLLVGLGATFFASLAAASDSPQFRGPQRDGVFPGKGLLSSWPEGGPKKLWSVSGLGGGFASVTVAGGRLFTTGESDGVGYVHAFDTRGKRLFQTKYGEIHKGGGYPGSRTTPTYHDGWLYLLSSNGKAVAIDAAKGEIGWSAELLETYGGKNIRWGVTESPLLVDDRVIFTPGGSDALLVALDRKTGEKVWATTGLAEPSAYCSPRLFENGKLRQIITLTKGHLIGVDPKNGELLWKHAYSGKWNIHAVSPVFYGNLIYVSDGYKQGGAMFELAEDGKSVSLKWQEPSLDVHHGGVVLVDGRIYGAASNGSWHVLDARTGEVLASQRRIGKGSVVYADGRLYGYTEKGEVLLVDPDPSSFEIVGRLAIDEGDAQHWAHPVISGNVLYIRHGDVLMAFDIGAPVS